MSTFQKVNKKAKAKLYGPIISINIISRDFDLYLIKSKSNQSKS